MQSMGLCLFSGRPFEDIFENAQWRKVEQMMIGADDKNNEFDDNVSASLLKGCWMEWDRLWVWCRHCSKD